MVTTTFVRCQEDNVLPEYRFSNYKDTPLSKLAEAVRDNDTIEIKNLIKKNDFDINYKEPNYGLDLLILSIANDKKEAFHTLINCGANVNSVCGKDFKTTPLLTAILFSENCNTFYVENLVKNNCNVNYKLNNGMINDVIHNQEFPLFESISKLSNGKRCTNLSKLLIENGANIYEKCYTYPFEEENNIIDYCITFKNVELLLYLFEERNMKIPEEIDFETMDGIKKINFLEYIKSKEFEFYYHEAKKKRVELIKLIKEEKGKKSN